MKIHLWVVLFAGLFVSASALADAALLAKRHGCMHCHAILKKTVGPSFKEISLKYKGDKDAKRFLRMKVRNGGSGSFGTVRMPAFPKVSDDDIEVMIAWILRL